jgi:ketosteroid isomerase-like protein
MKLTAVVLFTCICVVLVLADSPHPSFHAPFNNPADVTAVKQLEQNLGDAMVAIDIDKIGQFYADDWASVSTVSGKILTKEKLLNDFRSGNVKLVSFELGPMDVQVLGDRAVAHGGTIEKRLWNGKDDSGEVVWMDLLEKRAGKWVIVRSDAADVNRP